MGQVYLCNINYNYALVTTVHKQAFYTAHTSSYIALISSKMQQLTITCYTVVTTILRLQARIYVQLLYVFLISSDY